MVVDFLIFLSGTLSFLHIFHILKNASITSIKKLLCILLRRTLTTIFSCSVYMQLPIRIQFHVPLPIYHASQLSPSLLCLPTTTRFLPSLLLSVRECPVRQHSRLNHRFRDSIWSFHKSSFKTHTQSHTVHVPRGHAEDSTHFSGGNIQYNE